MLWEIDWMIGIPMVLATTIFHVCGLVLLGYSLTLFKSKQSNPPSVLFFLIISIYMANVVIILHGIEACGWAELYVFLGAIPVKRDALLYSLNAFTAYGHDPTMLEKEWKLLGAVEAMNGLLIFGLTTAFLFAALTQLRPTGRS